MVKAKKNIVKKKQAPKKVRETKKKNLPNSRPFKGYKKIDYGRIELFAKARFSDNEIVKGLAISKETFIKWKKDPKVKKILTDARKNIKENVSAPGPNTKYEPKYCQQMLDYFSVKPYEVKTETTTTKDETVTEKEYLEANDLPLLSGFADLIGVHRGTLKDWADVHPEFEYAYKRCLEKQSTILLTNGLRSLYNPSYASLVTKNWLGMKDKQDITTNNKQIKANTYVIPAFNNNIDEPDNESDNSGE